MPISQIALSKIIISTLFRHATEYWEEHGISTSDLKPFSQPPYSDILANNTQIHFLSYYLYWDPQENYYYCRENTGFSPILVVPKELIQNMT